MFDGSGYTLEALASGGFLLGAPSASAATTLEPARCVGMDIGAALPAVPPRCAAWAQRLKSGCMSTP